MQFVRFLQQNIRWLAGGFLLTFFSSFGQTFFISLSAGDIRREYGLSHGQFGLIYMAATLGSALTLPKLGGIVDRIGAGRVALFVMPMLALGTIGMAVSRHVALLLLTIYLLRLFGQGMMTHNAFTATGRWFAAQRGRALSVVTLGHNAGEALYPMIFVGLAAAIGWRNVWFAAALLILLALPVIFALLRVERAPRTTDPDAKVSLATSWTRAEVIRDPIFYALLLSVMAPGFIATTILFHQVYLVELRGWSLGIFASAFALSASMTVVFALVSGQLIDRLSGVALLPFFLLPLGTACVVLGLVDAPWSGFVFMALLGVSNGFSSTLMGALWPEIYGTRHLGSIRALIVAIMVLATAVGPGLTGFLIDRGVSYPAQIVAMGIYCFAVCVLMLHVSRRIRMRALRSPHAADTPPA